MGMDLNGLLDKKDSITVNIYIFRITSSQ
jgi:hypothetical protein